MSAETGWDKQRTDPIAQHRMRIESHWGTPALFCFRGLWRKGQSFVIMSRFRMSRCLFESVPALRGTEIVGFPLNRGLNALPFWEVGLTERVFDHHIINFTRISVGSRLF